jgi:hypothetical protein
VKNAVLYPHCTLLTYGLESYQTFTPHEREAKYRKAQEERERWPWGMGRPLLLVFLLCFAYTFS